MALKVILGGDTAIDPLICGLMPTTSARKLAPIKGSATASEITLTVMTGGDTRIRNMSFSATRST